MELHFTYDEEFGGEVGPDWLLAQRLTKPGPADRGGLFSYQVITAHNGCLQMEVTVHGQMAHAAIPDSPVWTRCKAATQHSERLVCPKQPVPQDPLAGGRHHRTPT